MDLKNFSLIKSKQTEKKKNEKSERKQKQQQQQKHIESMTYSAYHWNTLKHLLHSSSFVFASCIDNAFSVFVVVFFSVYFQFVRL